MLDGREALDGTAGDALGRRIGRDEIGMLASSALELVQQRVELVVGDLGLVVDVVALFVVADLVAELAMRAADPSDAIADRVRAQAVSRGDRELVAAGRVAVAYRSRERT